MASYKLFSAISVTASRMSALAFATSGYSAKYLRMVSLEHPRLRAAGAMSPRETSSASIISCGVYLWYVATCERSAFTNSDMLSFLFLVAKLSTLIARRHTFALWRDMCSAESPAAPLSRSALRESKWYRPYPTTPPYPRQRARRLMLLRCRHPGLEFNPPYGIVARVALRGRRPDAALVVAPLVQLDQPFTASSPRSTRRPVHN